jgi:hypothetical protein
MLELAFGLPPDPPARMNRYSPGYEQRAASDARYYNEITSFLFELFPDQLIRVTEYRRRFYHRHGIFSFDSA